MTGLNDLDEVVITRLGAQGDGAVGEGGAGRFVPFALPGERWRLRAGGGECLSESAERQAPVCAHFERCGGCVAQHMSDALYTAWKVGVVREGFLHRGIDADVLALRNVARHSRRRAFLGVERRGGHVTIGFREEGQHTLVDMKECAVLDAQIVAAVPGLRDMAQIVMPDREGGRLIVTKLDHGLDVAFDNGRRDLSPVERSLVADMASKLRFVRLVVAGELIAQRGPAVVTIGGVGIEPGPSMFLQAVPEAETALIDLMLAALPKKAKKALDLFAGVGTLAFPLARQMSVAAFDSDKRAVAALVAASRNAQGLKPIDARVRDLFREPLSVRELDEFDVVVFDPPRAGAQAQVERLAQSKINTVIAISCNPATLARDARILLDGGYKMGSVTPIDQFLYSAHIEAFTVFRR